jgi:hypothetical protein
VTALIAGSIALISLSATALALGWLMESAALIWASIAASVSSGVCLALAYARSRSEALAPAPPADPDRVRVRPARRPGPDTEAFALFDEDSDMAAPAAPPEVSVGGGPGGSPTQPETRSPARAAWKPQGIPATDDVVVAVPARGKFHRPECRFARVEGAERMPRSAARKRSLAPCGICRP